MKAQMPTAGHRPHTLVVATRNRHKAGEIRAILGPSWRVLDLTDFPEAPGVAEDAPTFAGNAEKKAVALAQWLRDRAAPAGLQGSEVLVLADDSGLEVDALDGAPGVRSARYAALDGPGGASGNSSDAQNNAKLLRLLENTPDSRRTGRFRCVLALVPAGPPSGPLAPIFFEGDCEGSIGRAPKGDGGFGYDPLFTPQGHTQTFAELGPEIKNALSHRARALAKLREFLGGGSLDQSARQPAATPAARLIGWLVAGVLGGLASQSAAGGAHAPFALHYQGASAKRLANVLVDRVKPGSGGGRAATADAWGSGGEALTLSDDRDRLAIPLRALSSGATSNPPAKNANPRQITVVLLGGQSNASGRAPATNLPPDAVDAQIEFFYDTDIFNAGTPVNSGNQFVPLAPPGATFGPEFSLARTLYHQYGLTNLAVVKHSKGGTSLHGDWAIGGSLYNSFLTTVQTALDRITSRGDTYRILGLAWHQGESDGMDGRTPDQYRADLTRFLAHVRQDLHDRLPGAGCEDLKWAVGEVVRPVGSGLSVAQGLVCSLDSAAQFVPTADLTYLADDLHYDAASQLRLGERLAAALMEFWQPTVHYLARTNIVTRDFAAGQSANDWFTGAAHPAPAVGLSAPAGTLVWTNADRGLLWHFFAPPQSPFVLRNPGDRLEASWQIWFQERPSGTAGNALRFGLYDSAGGQPSAHLAVNMNTDPAFTNWSGFLATYAVNSSNNNNSRFYLRASGTTNANPCSTVSAVTAIGGVFSGDVLAPGQFHTLGMAVEMAADELRVRSRLGAAGWVERTLAWSGQPVSLDAFALLNTPATAVSNLQLDNFVFTHVTNEPAAPASPPAVRFSEIMHQPAPASAAEQSAGYAAADFQFVELSNYGGQLVDAAGLRLARGLVLTVQEGVIPAGGTALLVKNRAAFVARYPGVATNLILGEFLGELADSEWLQLTDREGRVIDQVHYNADDQWPLVVAAGRSLTRKDPFGPPPLKDATPAWRVSRDVNGSPGGDDALTFAGWRQTHNLAAENPEEDSDGDGASNLCEFHGGTDPRDPLSLPRLRGRLAGQGSNQTFLVEFTRQIGADELTDNLLTSSDLRWWSAGETVITNVQYVDHGREVISHADTQPAFAATNRFAALEVRPATGAPPNVLFIAVDDLRPQLGVLGLAQMKTPNLDRLAATSRLFRHHYIQCPTCGASRYSMMTSRRPTTPAAASNDAFNNLFAGTNDPNQPNSLPQAFRFAGYRTISLGKLSHGPEGINNNQVEMPFAWDQSYMTSGIWGNAWNAFFAYAGGVTRVVGVSPRTEIGVAGDGLTSLLDTDYPDGLMAEEAIRRLREFKQSGEKFFLAVGFFKPHLPFAAPKKYWDLYDRHQIAVPPAAPPAGVNTALTLSGNGEFIGNYGGPNTVDDEEARLSIHGYYAALSYVDAQVGKVLDELEKLGLHRNTIVVLWGDHGWHLGEFGVWGKHTTLEQSLRSVLMIRTPSLPRRGVPSDALVEAVDIYPTLAELCGVKTGANLAGTSLAPLLRRPEAAVKETALSYWVKNSTDGYSIRDHRYRLVRWSPTGNFTNIVQLDLFDYQTDPAGATNVAALHPEVVANLLQKIPPP